MEEHKTELEKAREKITELLFAYDPPEKTYSVCCRMRYLALLAMETIENMEEASSKGDTETITRELAKYCKRYLQVTGKYNTMSEKFYFEC